IKAKAKIFQLKIGRSKDIVGLVDSILGSGAFSISGNALGIPQVEFAIPDYWQLPLTNNIVALKGSIAHGWLGKIPLNAYTSNVSVVNTYYHHFSVYGRLGKPLSKLHLYGGINHHAFWGNENQIFGE